MNDDITSLSLAASNNGYVLGGLSNMGPERAWMMRLNSNGTVNWSKRMDPSTNPGNGAVIGITERYSAVYGQYEYYGLTLSTGANGGMLVLKVDDNGNPFNQPPNINNEFLYNDGTGNVALPGAIGNLDAGPTGTNTGLHVFGTDQSAPGRFFMNQAFFNGATGTCGSPNQQNLTTMAASVQGPTVTYNFSFTGNNGLPPCRNHFTLDNKINPNVAQPCSFSGSPGGPQPGNNNRSSAPSGNGQGTISNGGVSVFPNPVSNTAEISYTAAEGGDVKISLCDVLGKHIKTLDTGGKKAGANTIRFDMNSLNLQNGVYLINVTIDGTTTQQKIIYTKN